MTSSQQKRRYSNGCQTAIQVLIRVKPSEAQEKTCLMFFQEDSIQCGHRVFSFDRVFTQNTTQQQIYNHVGVKTISNVLQGYNGCVFAYGQTGSGKTYTMTGIDDGSIANTGLVQRCIHNLWSVLQTYENVNFKVSFMEIYNQQIFDLLVVINQKEANQNLNLNIVNPQSHFKIKQDPKDGMYVQNLKVQNADSKAEMLQLLEGGLKNRHKGQTKMNRESSRSHSIFTIKISYQETNTLTKVRTIRNCKINFVDLAGSQKQKDTQAKGERLKQATNINKSLTHLTTVIMQLSSNNQREKSFERNVQDSRFQRSSSRAPYVSYRNSKLTYILKDSLGGNSKTTLIATVSSKSTAILQTLSTLAFAQRTKKVKQKAKINAFIQGDNTILKENITRLQSQLQELNLKLIKANQQNKNLKESLSDFTNERQQCQYCEQLCQYFNKLKKQYQTQICDAENRIKELQNSQYRLIQQIQQKQSTRNFFDSFNKQDSMQPGICMDMQQSQQGNSIPNKYEYQNEQAQSFYSINPNFKEFSLFTINQDTEPTKYSSNFNKMKVKQVQKQQKETKIRNNGVNQDNIRAIRVLQKQLEFKDLQIRQVKQQLRILKQSEEQLKQPLNLLQQHLRKLRFNEFQQEFMKSLRTKMQFAQRALRQKQQIWNQKLNNLTQEIRILKRNQAINQQFQDKTEFSTEKYMQKPRGTLHSSQQKQNIQKGSDRNSLDQRGTLQGISDNLFMEQHLGQKSQGIRQMKFYQSKNRLHITIKKMQQEIHMLRSQLNIQKLQNIKQKEQNEIQIQRLNSEMETMGEAAKYLQSRLSDYQQEINKVNYENSVLLKKIRDYQEQSRVQIQLISKQALNNQKNIEKSYQQKISKLQRHIQIYKQQFQNVKKISKKKSKQKNRCVLTKQQNQIQKVMRSQIIALTHTIKMQQQRIINQLINIKQLKKVVSQINGKNGSIFSNQFIDQSKDYKAKFAVLQQKCADYQKQIENMKCEIKQLNQEKINARDQLNKTQSKLSELKRLLSS